MAAGEGAQVGLVCHKSQCREPRGSKGPGEGVCLCSRVSSLISFPRGLLGNCQLFCGACMLQLSPEGCRATLFRCWCEGMLRVGIGSQASTGMEDFRVLTG